MTDEPVIVISPKLKALLVASKRSPQELEFNIESIKITLGELYSHHMSSKDAVTLMLKAVEEMRNEPRFEVLRHPEWWLELIFAPHDQGRFYDRSDTLFKMEQFYERIVQTCWSNLQCSRVDWCRHILWPEDF